MDEHFFDQHTFDCSAKHIKDTQESVILIKKISDVFVDYEEIGI